VAQLLAQAERPLIIAGSGVHFGSAEAALARFIDRTKIPCLSIAMGRGTLSDDHPACLGSGDVRLSPLAREAYRATDCVLVLGESFDFRLGYGRALSPQARVIQVHTDAVELGRNLRPSMAIVAHAAEWLAALDEAAAKLGAWKPSAWLAELKGAQNRAAATRQQGLREWTGPSLHPGSIADAVTEACGPAPFCAVLDMGDFATWCSHLPAREAGTIVGPIGTVGAAIPMGIAAKLARPDRKVVVFIGDGGFGMHSWELHTAIRLGVPIVVVIGNDAGWGMERQLQQIQLGRSVGVELGEVRYDRVVEAMGGIGIRVEQAAELAPALARAFHSGTVACVDVRIGSVASAITQGLLARR
jgi:acetolactate synthase-1/2/3 large subunit